MELNHVNFQVDDVQRAQEFMQEYFELELVGDPDAPVVALADERGLVFTLMDNGTEEVVTHPSHIGFFVDDRSTVDDFHDRLEEDGFTVTHTEVRHGTYDFYVEAPGGFSIEVGAWTWN